MISECKAFNQSLSFVNDKLNLDLDLGLTIFELEKKFYKLEMLVVIKDNVILDPNGMGLTILWEGNWGFV